MKRYILFCTALYIGFYGIAMSDGYDDWKAPRPLPVARSYVIVTHWPDATGTQEIEWEYDVPKRVLEKFHIEPGARISPGMALNIGAEVKRLKEQQLR